MAAADFFAVDVWSWRGLVTHYVLFVIDLATRRIQIAGTTVHPGTDWMMRVARNLLDVVDGSAVEQEVFAPQVIRLPPRSANLNAYAERWIRSVRDECLLKLLPIGQGMLRRALREYVAHHHLERETRRHPKLLRTTRRMMSAEISNNTGCRFGRLPPPLGR